MNKKGLEVYDFPVIGSKELSEISEGDINRFFEQERLFNRKGDFIESLSIPCVDGLRYVDRDKGIEGVIFTNGIVEFYQPMDRYYNAIPTSFAFDNEIPWRNISLVMQGYQKVLVDKFGKQRYFGCVSIIGFKGAVSERRDYPDKDILIDRDELLCNPVLFVENNDKDQFSIDMKRQHLELLLSVGVKKTSEVAELSREIMEWDALRQ